MYPLTLIRVSKGKIIEVELKNNEVYEGILVGCDLLMNMYLRNISVKNKLGESYFLSECFLKGSVVKHVKLAEDVLSIQRNLERKKSLESN